MYDIWRSCKISKIIKYAKNLTKNEEKHWLPIFQLIPGTIHKNLILGRYLIYPKIVKSSMLSYFGLKIQLQIFCLHLDYIFPLLNKNLQNSFQKSWNLTQQQVTL